MEVFELFEKYGSADYIGEPVSQMSHMIQTAMLAEAGGESQEIVLAALFHDIGHLVCLSQELGKMGDYGGRGHENIGAEFLVRHGFSNVVCDLVGNHVQAKRYRVWKDPGYQLSEASRRTLIYQGGPMTDEEAAQFEQRPDFEVSLRLRDWDDQAKRTDVQLKPLDYYREMVSSNLNIHPGSPRWNPVVPGETRWNPVKPVRELSGSIGNHRVPPSFTGDHRGLPGPPGLWGTRKLTEKFHSQPI